MTATKRGRGRLSAIDLLPGECDEAISWAAGQLSERRRSQLDIYAEWRSRLIAVQGETGADFDIPSFQSFNRYSVRLAEISRRLEVTREIAASMSERFDGKSSDDLTRLGAATIKTLVYEILEAKGSAGISPKDAKELANAMRAAVAAEKMSTQRRVEVQEEFEKQAEEAIEKAAKEAGLSAETVAQLRRDFLGVQ